MRKALILILASLLVVGFLGSVGWARGAATARVLIGFKGAPDPAVVEAFGGEVEHVYGIIPAVCAVVPTRALEGLRRHPAVDYVEFDGTCYALAQTVPWGVNDIGAPRVWAEGNKGDNVKVCIIDTGVDIDHPDLAYYGGYDFVNGDTNPDDDNGHGTHMAGIVAALDNTIGVVGVAPLAHLYAVKVLNAYGAGTWSAVVSGIDWARSNGMNVINMSFGGTTSSTSLRNACQNAWNAGLVLVASSSDSVVVYPAVYPCVIPVVPVDKNHVRVGLCGGPVELSAPGVSIYSTYRGGAYATLSGYSPAALHVAGVACLVKYAQPGATNQMIRDAMDFTAIDLGPMGRDNCYGYGLVWAPGAVHYPPASD